MADKGIPVTLIVADDCHLCERARQVLASVSKETTVALREVSWQSEEGISLVRRDGVPSPPCCTYRIHWPVTVGFPKEPFAGS